MTDSGRTDEGDGSEADDEPLPQAVVEQAQRLTRLARDAVDDAEATAYRDRRETVLADHGYTARVRDDDPSDVLVLHPDEWLADGLVDLDRIEDVDRGIERPLGGPSVQGDWEAVHEHNRAVADRVRAEHSAVHGENAEAFAAFMSNHHARPVADATAAQREEFLTEYFPRNAWPSDRQRAVVERSVELAVETAADLNAGPE
jgi:hypothetical protein